MKKIILFLLIVTTSLFGQVELISLASQGDVTTTQLSDSLDNFLMLNESFWHWYKTTHWASFSSSISNRPLFQFTNLNSDGLGVRFNYIKGVVPSVNDTILDQVFISYDDGMLSSERNYGRSFYTVTDPSEGSYSGAWSLNLANEGNAKNYIEVDGEKDTLFFNSSIKVDGSVVGIDSTGTGSDSYSTRSALVDTSSSIRSAIVAAEGLTADLEGVFFTEITDTMQVTTGGTFEEFPAIIALETQMIVGSDNFDITGASGAPTGNSIIYTGSDTKDFLVDVSFNIISVENNQNISVKLKKNSSEVDHTDITSYFNSSGDSRMSRILYSLELAQNDTIFFLFTSDTNSDYLFIPKIFGHIEEIQ